HRTTASGDARRPAERQDRGAAHRVPGDPAHPLADCGATAARGFPAHTARRRRDRTPRGICDVAADPADRAGRSRRPTARTVTRGRGHGTATPGPVVVDRARVVPGDRRLRPGRRIRRRRADTGDRPAAARQGHRAACDRRQACRWRRPGDVRPAAGPAAGDGRGRADAECPARGRPAVGIGARDAPAAWPCDAAHPWQAGAADPGLVDRAAVTGVAVAAGPAMVLGPHPVDPELGAAAVEFIDDELALVAGKPRSVTGLWRQVLHAAAGADPPAVRLICPRWWSRDRVQRVFDAARTVAELVEVHRRAELLAERAGTTGAVVEIAPEHVAVCAAGTVELVARSDDVDGVCSVVCATVTTLPVRPAAVLVDAPAEVPGAAVLAGILADRLRRRRIAVTVAEPDWWRQPPAEPERKTRAPGKTDRFGARRRRRPAAGGVVAGAVLAALTLTLMGVWPSSAGPERTETTMPDSMPTTLL